MILCVKRTSFAFNAKDFLGVGSTFEIQIQRKCSPKAFCISYGSFNYGIPTLCNWPEGKHCWWNIPVGIIMIRVPILVMRALMLMVLLGQVMSKFM